ncbi:MAG: LysR substrate-binding domain-containing protein [Terriglobia bacterium]
MGRKVTLTPFGERFEQHSKRILLELEGARHDIEEIKGLRRGRVSLGVIPTVAPYLLPSLLRAFRAAGPSITTTIWEDLTSSLTARLAGGDLDLALLSLPLPYPEFVAEATLSDRMLLALPARHRLLRQRPRRVGFDEVAEEPFLLLKDGHCFRDDVLNLCKRSHLTLNIVFEAGQFDTLLAMVAAGLGITLLPEMGRARFKHSGVRLVELEEPEPRRTVGLVRWRAKFLSPAARLLIDLTRKLFGEEKQGARDKRR